MISKAAMGIAVGIAGIFVGYCFYFDQKRRSDPDFKKKLRERRKAKKEARRNNTKFPDLNDHAVAQRYFMNEVRLGDELLAYGNIEGAVEHLANAIAVCGQPEQLLQVLQKTLPPQVYHFLVQRIPVAERELSSQPAMAEEEVE